MLSVPLPCLTTLVIVFFAVAFSRRNDQAVSIRLFGWRFERSLVLVWLTALCPGMIIAMPVSMPTHIRNNTAHRAPE